MFLPKRAGPYLISSQCFSHAETLLIYFLDEMINKKLRYNKKTDHGLDSLYKSTEIDDETPLDLSYLC